MEKELIEYGLSEKEARLYLLCLRTGETTANRLIELSGLPRGTVYDILEKLKVKGLISSLIKEKTTYFRANDPEVLVKALEEKKTNIQRILPKLKEMQNIIGSKAIIEVFEGIAGVRKILDDALDNCKEVIIMGNEQYARQAISHHPENFRMKRLERKIKIKNLLEESKTARTLRNDKYSKVKHIEQLKDSKEVLIIYNDVTAHMIMEEPTTIIKVTSEEYTKTQRMMFDNLWNIAKA